MTFMSLKEISNVSFSSRKWFLFALIERIHLFFKVTCKKIKYNENDTLIAKCKGKEGKVEIDELTSGSLIN